MLRSENSPRQERGQEGWVFFREEKARSRLGWGRPQKQGIPGARSRAHVWKRLEVCKERWPRSAPAGLRQSLECSCKVILQPLRWGQHRSGAERERSGLLRGRHSATKTPPPGLRAAGVTLLLGGVAGADFLAWVMKERDQNVHF